jgi:hypothetical protein
MLLASRHFFISFVVFAPGAAGACAFFGFSPIVTAVALLLTGGVLLRLGWLLL